MTTILLVDDEPLIRRGLESMIHWNELECHLAGQAQNGEEGLQKIQEYQPDIVFTDIKMPKMNGIDMIKKAQGAPCPPVFIILSGYNDFELVRDAMKLGAIDYLMKLDLEEKELVRVITEAKQRKEPKNQERCAEEGGSQNFKADFIRELLTVKADKEVYERVMPESFAMKEGYYYRVIYLRISDRETGDSSQEEKNLFQNFLLNLCKEQISDGTEFYACQVEENTFVLYVESRGIILSEILKEKSQLLAKEIRRYLNRDAFLGISLSHQNIIRLPFAMEEAVESMAFQIDGLEATVHFYTDLMNRNNLEVQLQRLKNDDTFFESVENLLLQIQKFIYHQGHIEDAYQICDQLIQKIYRLDTKSREFFTQWFGKEYQGYEDMKTIGDIKALRTWLLRLGQGCNIYGQQYMGEIYRYKVKKAKQYIYENRLKKIYLNDVAGELEITPSYLSRIFKKVTSQSFSDYIAEVKIEEAKLLLLQNNNRIYEVSAMLGYDDPYYFSKVFKKVTQMTPSEYIAGH